MNSADEIKKWRQKLSPYITEVQLKLYKEEQKREQQRRLQEKCKRCV
jgi:hypothetical protein